MVTQAPKRTAVAVAVAFALSCVGLIIFVWTQFGGSIPFAATGYHVRAVFSETGLLVPGADVRIAGVNVGRVTAVAPRGTNSLVTMDIQPRFVPIPADTRAILREKTLLGEGFVALSPGSPTAPKLPDGGTIPNSQVQKAQQLDQVLNSFNGPTQRNLQRFLLGFGAALKGDGQYLNDAFGNFDPAVTELSAVVGVLNQQQGSVRSLLNSGASVLGTLSSRRAELQSLVTAGNSVMSATAARNAALTATVNSLPPFLAQLRRTLVTLNGTLGIARPSLAALRPVTPLLTPALHGLVTLSGPVIHLLQSAPPVLRQAETTLPDIGRFMTAFRPAVDALLPAAQQLAPVIEIVAEFRQELTAGQANLAAILQGQSAAGTPPGGFPSGGGMAHYLRSLTTLGSDSVFGQSVRSPGERSNTYFAPGELNNIANGGLLSSSCSNTGNTAQFPAGTANVPCRLQPGFPWGHGIPRSYYPRVTKAKK